MPADQCLIRTDSGRVVIAKLALATTFWQRFRGLQFRPALPPGEGLLIPFCRSIHTCWMRFPIDVVMLDRDGVVLAVHRWVKPWRMLSGPRGTRAVLEVTAGTLPDGLDVGDGLQVVPPRDSRDYSLAAGR